ncbi:hypothetical protein FBULB1_9605 [Fusarium bulbicola]|nr:hypothetical protein FBULB1_9605 [Fusarium bulbicola]
MHGPEIEQTFVPKQALAPTPELYGEIVGDGMEGLATASLSCLEPFDESEVIFHDVGCGLGAGTAAVASLEKSNIVIKGTDIEEHALELYRQSIATNKWRAEALKMDVASLDFPDETFTHCIGNGLLFIGGMAGWLESDEENWDTAVEAVKEALTQTEGFERLEDGKNRIMFRAHVAVATK